MKFTKNNWTMAADQHLLSLDLNIKRWLQKLPYEHYMVYDLLMLPDHDFVTSEQVAPAKKTNLHITLRRYSISNGNMLWKCAVPTNHKVKITSVNRYGENTGWEWSGPSVSTISLNRELLLLFDPSTFEMFVIDAVNGKIRTDIPWNRKVSYLCHSEDNLFIWRRSGSIDCIDTHSLHVKWTVKSSELPDCCLTEQGKLLVLYPKSRHAMLVDIRTAGIRRFLLTEPYNGQNRIYRYKSICCAVNPTSIIMIDTATLTSKVAGRLPKNSRYDDTKGIGLGRILYSVLDAAMIERNHETQAEMAKAYSFGVFQYHNLVKNDPVNLMGATDISAIGIGSDKILVKYGPQCKYTGLYDMISKKFQMATQLIDAGSFRPFGEHSIISGDDTIFGRL